MPAVEQIQQVYRAREPGPVHLVTVCTGDRRTFLTTPDAIGILTAAWRVSPRLSGWSIGRYVVMPDHLHFFVHAERPLKPLGEFIEDWKTWTARLLTDVMGVPPPVWQEGFFEESLPSLTLRREKWELIRSNPVRRGHVDRVEDWPYLGEIEKFPG